VLPFLDMSEKKDQEYFSDGLSEELIDRLSRSRQLRVIARTSSFTFKGTKDDVRTIARKLGVSHVLEGSVRKAGNTLRVTAQLIRASDASHLWSRTYERTLEATWIRSCAGPWPKTRPSAIRARSRWRTICGGT
jgi:TolB-like protein